MAYIQCITLISIVSFVKVNTQLAAIYSNVSRTNDCNSWKFRSSWGPCVWPDARSKLPYLAQLTPPCQQHWFYKFIGTYYGTTLQSFFDYLLLIMKSPKPCGVCSYRQSCGYGGPMKCHQSSFEIQGGRAITPFFVSEKVCSKRDLNGTDQLDACQVDYDLVKENGGECKLWPSQQVNLDQIDPMFRNHIANLEWYFCIPQIKQLKSKSGKTKAEKTCRCCCYPFRPNPVTFKCEQAPDTLPPPGIEDLY